MRIKRKSTLLTMILFIVAAIIIAASLMKFYKNLDDETKFTSKKNETMQTEIATQATSFAEIDLSHIDNVVTKKPENKIVNTKWEIYKKNNAEITDTEIEKLVYFQTEKYLKNTDFSDKRLVIEDKRVEETKDCKIGYVQGITDKTHCFGIILKDVGNKICAEILIWEEGDEQGLKMWQNLEQS